MKFTIPGRRSKVHENTSRPHKPNPLSQAPMTCRDTIEGIDKNQNPSKATLSGFKRNVADSQDQFPKWVGTIPFRPYFTYSDVVRGGEGSNIHANFACETRASGSGKATQDLDQGQGLEIMNSEYQVNETPDSSVSAVRDRTNLSYRAAVNSYGERNKSINDPIRAKTSSQLTLNVGRNHDRIPHAQTCKGVRQRNHDDTSLRIEEVPPLYRDTIRLLVKEGGLAEQHFGRLTGRRYHIHHRNGIAAHKSTYNPLDRALVVSVTIFYGENKERTCHVYDNGEVTRHQGDTEFKPKQWIG